jgi:NitT/TauT family transport system ATP-binding protein
MGDKMNYVAINNVSFAYEEEKTILDNINLRVEKGEFICILGQSGCGKSTLLRLIAGLEMPTSGTVFVDGEEVKGASLDRGVVFQDYGLFPWMTAGKNILLALEQKYPKRRKSELKNIVCEKLGEVGLDRSVYSKYPRELSGGMQQRCAIAQALSIESPLLLMDEPFGALDAVTRAALQDMIRNLLEGENRKTVFFVTHDVDEAVYLADKIVVMDKRPGRIKDIVEVPLERPRQRESREFLDFQDEVEKLLGVWEP